MNQKKPKRTTRRVYDIIKDLDLFNDTNESLKIVVDNETIATHTEILNLWLQRTEWLYSQSDLVHYMTVSGEILGGYILPEWVLYVSRNGENLKRMIDALYSEYNPIDNYNLTELEADGVKQDAHKTTPHGTITTESETKKAGIDTVGDGSISDVVTGTTSYQNADTETTYDNTKSIVFDGETKTGYHHATEKFLKRYGNVGVTTSAQMITQELELRIVDLLDEFVKRFFYKYCYYVG